ncbi:hypothetical protein K438DRAFT_1944433 [Mycena galopus ATCC 62051]|nr:hypothetical protein K438DRAFT_1944433 [Mycena galopus ATCC 62051]
MYVREMAPAPKDTRNGRAREKGAESGNKDDEQLTAKGSNLIEERRAQPRTPEARWKGRRWRHRGNCQRTSSSESGKKGEEKLDRRDDGADRDEESFWMANGKRRMGRLALREGRDGSGVRFHGSLPMMRKVKEPIPSSAVDVQHIVTEPPEWRARGPAGGTATQSQGVSSDREVPGQDGRNTTGHAPPFPLESEVAAGGEKRCGSATLIPIPGSGLEQLVLRSQNINFASAAQAIFAQLPLPQAWRPPQIEARLRDHTFPAAT